jgi:4-diphosphocytidyl-2-C-methyl-D-erythritol kinase
MPPAAFTLPSFAKINLTLHVLNRRTDNYHNLRTVFQTITLQDKLRFALTDDEQVHLRCDAPGIPVNEKNLVYSAARLMQEHYGVKKGAFIALDKSIPAMGGLGGGSSNAAITLLGLAQLWKVSATRAELMELGAGLGADVPFFFVGGRALGTGLGTEVAALHDATSAYLVVVTPDAAVSTAEAYKAFDERALTKAKSDTILFSSRADDSFTDSLPEALHNDFEPVIFRLEPKIERARDALLEAGASRALLAGSGASVFGIFESVAKQQRAALKLAENQAWRVFKCATLGREEYLTALGSCAALLRA